MSIYDDLPWIEADDRTSYRFKLRTPLPLVEFGAPKTKETAISIYNDILAELKLMNSELQLIRVVLDRLVERPERSITEKDILGGSPWDWNKPTKT